MINDLVRKVETTKIPPQIPLEMDLDEFLPLSEGLGSGPIEFDYKGRSVMFTGIPEDFKILLDGRLVCEFIFGEWYNVNEDLAKEILL